MARRRLIRVRLLAVVAVVLAGAVACGASEEDQKIIDTASGYYLEKVRADPTAGDLLFGAMAVDACAFAEKELGQPDDERGVAIDFSLNAATVHNVEQISTVFTVKDFERFCRLGLSQRG